MKKQTGIYLLIGIIFYILGVLTVIFFGAIVLPKLSSLNSHYSVSTSSTNVSLPENKQIQEQKKQPEVNFILGNIAEKGDNLLKIETLKLSNSATSSNKALLEKKKIITVEINSNTKIYELVPTKETLDYLTYLKDSEKKKENTSGGRPLKFKPKKEISFSDLKVNDSVKVVADKNVTGLNTIKASEIFVYRFNN